VRHAHPAQSRILRPLRSTVITFYIFPPLFSFDPKKLAITKFTPLSSLFTLQFQLKIIILYDCFACFTKFHLHFKNKNWSSSISPAKQAVSNFSRSLVYFVVSKIFFRFGSFLLVYTLISVLFFVCLNSESVIVGARSCCCFIYYYYYYYYYFLSISLARRFWNLCIC
jgi:hypothetical protein